MSREQLLAQLLNDAERLILSDVVFRELRSIKKVFPVLLACLARERRRKKRSPQFKWLLAEAFNTDTPVPGDSLANFREVIQVIRKQMEGEDLPPDTGERMVQQLKNLVAIRTEPRYWREYRAYCNGKQVSEILREFHPEYDQLHGWDREKYFRKIYNAIQRLVEKFGGPRLSTGFPPHQI